MFSLTLLVDNNTYIDRYYLGEPGFSAYMECDQKRILFDTGYSNVFLLNAKKLNIDLNNLDYVVLSHGHNDHVGGISYLIKECDVSNTILITHPDTFTKKYNEGLEVGPDVFVEELKKHFKQVYLTKEPYPITSNLIYLSEIERSNDFENKSPVGYYLKDNEKIEDYLREDSALVYYKNDLNIITGCSHSGICNICEMAKKVCQKEKIEMIIGGFHLFEKNKVLEKTIDYFKKNQIKELYPCHCVSLTCKNEMARSVDILEAGVSLKIERD